MRMRPANFPTIRISQMAGVLHNISGDITQLFDVDNINKLRILLSSNASKYWNTHYKFGNEVRSTGVRLPTGFWKRLTFSDGTKRCFYFPNSNTNKNWDQYQANCN